MTTTSIAASYERDGFVSPIELLSEAEAVALRADLEAGEAELADQPDKLALLRGNLPQILPSFAALVRQPRLIDMVSQVLGPDLLVWGTNTFIKEPRTPNHLSWHQDLTYWGLDDEQELTAWVALSPATTASGCMRFVAGSHARPIVPHVDTFAQNNMLTRGQEIAVDVDEAEATDVELRPGQCSMHHGHLFHASGPNSSDDRRIGIAVRYITPAMAMQGGERPLASLVSGEDRYGHFELMPPPAGRLQEADFARVRRHQAIMRPILFQGADESKRG